MICDGPIKFKLNARRKRVRKLRTHQIRIAKINLMFKIKHEPGLVKARVFQVASSKCRARVDPVAREVKA